MSVIDAYVAHQWSTITELTPYMNSGWKELILRPGTDLGPNQMRGRALHRNPLGDFAPDTYPTPLRFGGTEEAQVVSDYGHGAVDYTENSAPGSDPALLIRQLLRTGKRSRVVLGYSEVGMLATAFANVTGAEILTRAVNDWTADRWYTADPRLYGTILVTMANPQGAAAEIRRLGPNSRFVGVALGTNGLAMPFGSAVYHPVYEAAAEFDLPIVIQVGSDSAPSLMGPPIGGGIASTYSETHISAADPLQAHVGSLMYEGVFELFPNLRVLLVGGGLSWFPSFTWRLEYWYNHMRGSGEIPLMKRPPSEYIRRHVRLAASNVEPSRDGRLATQLRTVSWLGEIVMYGSGYPALGWEEADAVSCRLPAEWGEAVTRANADSFFRFPATGGSEETQ